MSEGKSTNRVAVNRYHAAAIIYLLASVAVGAAVSGGVSPRLQASGWRLFHAYLALMGFGTMMILGSQRALVPVARLIRTPGMRLEYKRAGVFGVLNVTLWVTWAAFLLKESTGSEYFYFGTAACGFVVMGCLAVFAQRMYGDVSPNSFWRNMPIRYFATSLFMCFLAYWQMAHITANDIKPFLPFSRSLTLRHNYLALSIPISLTIIGAMNIPFYQSRREGRIGGARLWEAQYATLVSGVFALFFSILFDDPAHHGLMQVFERVFSSLLVLSIIILAVAVLKDGSKLPNLPAGARRFYFCAIFWLAAAGAAGFLLGYGWDNRSPMFYFLLQTHIHLALLGWVGMGLTGVVYYLLSLSGAPEDAKGKIQFWLMNAGIVVLSTGIYFKSMALRCAGGGLVGAAFVVLLLAILPKIAGAMTERDAEG